MKVDLSGKIALVTGAARGIGKAIADTLAENGAKVVFTDVDADVAKQSASRWPNCKAMKMDVTDEAEVQKVVDAMMREYGRIDILVNNAGVNTAMNERVTFDKYPLKEWNRIINVDLNGVFIVSKAVGAIMRSQGTGRIINISSIVGMVPLRMQCAYVAAKAGVINLTQAMALELGSEGITVNAVSPGSTVTDFTKGLFYSEDGSFKGLAEKLMEHIPCRRPGRPEDMAAAVLYLASPQASYVNGAILPVDGGWIAGYSREF